jgi:Fe-S-cluster containining protein
VAPNIEALRKPCGVPCQHLTNARTGCCSIYKDRPTTCQEFVCVWLTNKDMPKKFRPDRCGIMLSGRWGTFIDVWELKQKFIGSELASWLAPRIGNWKLRKVEMR